MVFMFFVCFFVFLYWSLDSAHISLIRSRAALSWETLSNDAE